MTPPNGDEPMLPQVQDDSPGLSSEWRKKRELDAKSRVYIPDWLPYRTNITDDWQINIIQSPHVSDWVLISDEDRRRFAEATRSLLERLMQNPPANPPTDE